ncbi:MAG: hypothetical protein INH43_21730, partial [Acidobacteriaceae bacterium]|nr:hypothetical protein [Acidobacteriaceae bacterium]
TLGSDRNLDQISLDQIRRLTDKAAMPLGPVVRIVQKRTGRAGPAPTGEELAHPAEPKRVRCARIPQETAEATIEVWKDFSAKDLLPAAVKSVLDDQIAKAARGTLSALKR